MPGREIDRQTDMLDQVSHKDSQIDRLIDIYLGRYDDG